MHKAFSILFHALLAVTVVLYGTCCDYNPVGAKIPADSGPDRRESLFPHHYPMFQDVNVMIFIGFGFLMSFLQRSGFTATGHSYLVAAFTILWSILVRGFFRRAIMHDHPGGWTKITVGLTEAVEGEFAAGAILISFGAIIGRVSATQLLVMAFFETIFYALNEAILVHRLGVVDLGGSMIIHAFGALFGLAVSWVTTRKEDAKSKSCEGMTSSDLTDTIAMAGTLFLFCYWPSFNGAMSNYELTGERAVLNTFLSILTSVLVAFYVCTFVYNGKFRIVEIQNSTLAGGVAVGASADFNLHLFGALLIGAVAGAVSVVGYRYLQSFLQEKITLRDTCGILNLHGMPGIIGGLASVIGAAAAKEAAYGASFYVVFPALEPSAALNPHFHGRTAGGQAGIQMAGLGITMAISLGAGAVVGLIMQRLPTLDDFFHDGIEYHADDVGADEGELLPPTDDVFADQPTLAQATSGHQSTPAAMKQSAASGVFGASAGRSGVFSREGLEGSVGRSGVYAPNDAAAMALESLSPKRRVTKKSTNPLEGNALAASLNKASYGN